MEGENCSLALRIIAGNKGGRVSVPIGSNGMDATRLDNHCPVALRAFRIFSSTNGNIKKRLLLYLKYDPWRRCSRGMKDE